MRRSELRQMIREEITREKKVDHILSEQQLNEDVLTIAGGVVLGLVGFMAAKKLAGAGTRAAYRWLDKKTAEMEKAKRIAAKTARNEKYKAAVDSVAQKFANDSQLDAMLKQLASVPYSDDSKRKERSKLLRQISSYVKGKLDPQEARLLKGVLKQLRGEEVV